MSNDTGVAVKYNAERKKWQVLNINMSSYHESLKSEHDNRAEAIEVAAKAADYPVEYGVVHIDPPKPESMGANSAKKRAYLEAFLIILWLAVFVYCVAFLAIKERG